MDRSIADPARFVSTNCEGTATVCRAALKVGLDRVLHVSTDEVYGSIEGVIQLFELKMHNRGWDTPVGEVYDSSESPNGELGYYIVADGDRCAFRASTRPPSFLNYQVFAKLVEGHQIADVPAILGSLNIIAAELDR